MRTVDLNADLGEGFGIWPMGDDVSLLDVVTSANVACGFHAGDASIMRRVCALAAERGVSIGAQVGYHDLHGFGRRFIDVAPTQLADEVLYQIAALDGIARTEGSEVRYVKPHGALYNAIVHHEAQAAAVVEAVTAFRRGLPVYGLPGSVWLRRAADAGLTPVFEAFPDRAYAADATLVPRNQPNSVLHSPDAVAARAVRMVVEGKLDAIDGTPLDITAHTLCVHGDTPESVAVARAVRAALESAQVELRPVA